jgi:pyrroline-5-carboxylate reductase
VRIASLSRWLDGYQRIVRAMPNTPALVGCGIAGAYAPAAVDERGRTLAGSALEAVGDVIWVAREDMLDAVTASAAAVPRMRSTSSRRSRIARASWASASRRAQARYATFAGAIKLAQASDLRPATLRAQVTSKGGTTERAISVLDERAVKAQFVAAVKAAAARAKELGDEQL